ncbi:Pv-fam-d protein, partial [Plasmodium malariae]
SSTLGKSCSSSESQNSSLGIRSSRLLKGETVLDLGTRSNNNQRRNGLNTLISFDKNFESSTDSIFPDENIRNKHKKKSQNGNFASSTDSIFPDENIINKHKKLNQNRNFESSMDSIFPDENIRNKHKKLNQNRNFESSTDSIFTDENIRNKRKKQNQNSKFERNFDVSMYGHNKRDSSGSVAYIDDSNSSYSSLYNKKDYYKEKLHNKNGIKVNRKKAKEDISELEKRKGNQEKCLVTYVMNFISKSDALYETELLKYMTMYNKHGRDGQLEVLLHSPYF